MQSRKPRKSMSRTAGERTHTPDRKNRGIHRRDEWKTEEHDGDDDNVNVK